MQIAVNHPKLAKILAVNSEQYKNKELFIKDAGKSAVHWITGTYEMDVKKSWELLAEFAMECEK